MEADQESTCSRDEQAVNTNVDVSEAAYAIGILGDVLAPALSDGDQAVFDPEAGRALRHEIVAIWLKGEGSPFIVKLATAVPPMLVDENDEFQPALMVCTTSGRMRPLSMRRVRRVDRLVDVVRRVTSELKAA